MSDIVSGSSLHSVRSLGNSAKKGKVMTVVRIGLSEELVAQLARAAYLVALKHGVRGPFIDIELELWRELQRVAREHGEHEEAA
jgi:hypothetical protein